MTKDEIDKVKAAFDAAPQMPPDEWWAAMAESSRKWCERMSRARAIQWGEERDGDD